jgi:uncharacterized alkaline shock family protein YloU
MEERAAALRNELAKVLEVQTELNIQAINITVTDVLELPAPAMTPNKPAMTPNKEDQP